VTTDHLPRLNSSQATRCKPKENPGAASVQRSARRSHRATIPHRQPQKKERR
jgi:hypothetical protein